MTYTEKEKIFSYIFFKETKVPKISKLLSFLMIYLIIAIPSSLFGKFVVELKPAMFLMIFIITIWTVYLMFKKDKWRAYVLYQGVFSTSLSFVLLIASYKFAVTIVDIRGGILLLGIVLFAILGCLNVLNIKRKVRNNYFIDLKNDNKYVFVPVMISALLYRPIKSLMHQLSQYEVIIIISSLLIVMATVFMMGIHNFLKYYYLLEYDIVDSEIIVLECKEVS